MNYKILSNKPKTKLQRNRESLKWFLYSICILLLYALMCSGAFNLWQPFLIIPFAVSVSLYERELSSCVFALICGYLIDIACHFIFGFSAVWLMIVCLMTSLLSKNLIRVNIINFMWINMIAVLLEFFMDYLFNVLIWDIPNRDIILNNITFPSILSTILISPLIYLLVKCIYNRLGAPLPLNPDLTTIASGEDDLISKK